MAEAPPGPGDAADLKEQRSRIFAALRELFARICERRPLVLAIDDLQWADADSIAMLGQILRPPEAPPLLLLATTHAFVDGGPAGWEAAIKALHESAIQKLHLGPLPREAARALAERLLSQTSSSLLHADGKLAEDLARESGGHPLFIDALIQHAAARGPAQREGLRLEDAMSASIDRMDGVARRLFSLIAVAGRPIGPKLLGAATEL